MNYVFFFFILLLGLSPVKAIHNLDINQEFRSSYQLQERYSTKLDIEAMNTGIQPLIQQGFSAKKAREVYAHPHVLKIFEEQFNLRNGENFFRSLGGKVTTSFDPTKKGPINDIFVPILSYTVDHLQQGIAGKIGVTYTQIHYDDIHSVKPHNLFAELHKHSMSGPYLDTLYWAVQGARTCGITTVIPPFPGLIWATGMRWAFETAKNPMCFKMLKLEQTVTIIQPDGTLTVYDVTDE